MARCPLEGCAAANSRTSEIYSQKVRLGHPQHGIKKPPERRQIKNEFLICGHHGPKSVDYNLTNSGYCSKVGGVHGYARFSTLDQNEQRQLEAQILDQVFTDQASGKDPQRPKLDELIRFARGYRYGALQGTQGPKP